MRRKIAIKNHTEEIRLINRRLIAVCVLMGLLIFLLILRLAFLQIVRHDVFITLSNKNWLDLMPVEPTRGLIYDRNGILIAENVPVFSLDVIPDKVTNLPQTLHDLGKIIELTDTDRAQFKKQLRQHRRFDEVTLKLRLSEAEVAQFAENQYQFPGVFIHARLIRHYPFGSTFSHVLGHVGRINVKELQQIDPIEYSATTYIGKSGIEKFYETRLHGHVGYQQAENDASGEVIRILKQIPPIPGENLQLTLDSRLQQIAEAAFVGHRGALVAVEPTTGDILAMVSYPGFEPDNFVTGMSNDDYHALQTSIDRPLFDRALRGLYPPGSTIKPFIAIEGLESGVVTPEETIFDPGWFKLEGSNHIFHDWQHRGHGTVNLTRAIVTSCDTYFFNLSQQLGIARIDSILAQFGFGEKSGIDLPDERTGIVASPAYKQRVKRTAWYRGDTVISSIGQGYMQFTPLQLAAATATLAMQGVRHTPHLLKTQTTSTEASPIVLTHKNSWKVIINAMEKVVTSPEGTGNLHFGRPNYTVAIKTGTAQVHSIHRQGIKAITEDQSKLPEHLRDNSLFIGFAPVEHPQIAIAVIAENDTVAGPIARTVIDAWLKGKH